MKAFGKYENLSLIGSGATADVYLAQDKTLARPVALKVLKASLVSDAQSFERFLLEARSAANLFHPHIATVLDMGETEGRFYIAMRYYEGQSLQERLAKEGRLSWDETLRLAEQIGSALDYAHRKGLLHRDVKPSNILCTQDGDFVLTDFGLTRAMMNTGLTSHTGAILGTPAYIAPEIWAGRAASPATDQYSLACVLAECLSGERLFQGETPPEIMTRHMLDGPQFPGEWPGGVPGEVGKVLERALDRKAEARWPNCGVLSEELKSLHQPGLPPQPAISETPKQTEKHQDFEVNHSMTAVVKPKEAPQQSLPEELDTEPVTSTGVAVKNEKSLRDYEENFPEMTDSDHSNIKPALILTGISTVFLIFPEIFVIYKNSDRWIFLFVAFIVALIVYFIFFYLKDFYLHDNQTLISEPSIISLLTSLFTMLLLVMDYAFYELGHFIYFFYSGRRFLLFGLIVGSFFVYRSLLNRNITRKF